MYYLSTTELFNYKMKQEEYEELKKRTLIHSIC
uniref:Uncharacterized protein n=1 Tax=Heterorhabditis bacteriophora TaxID=37862 RepID=A0A1I7WWN9_HETBA